MKKVATQVGYEDMPVILPIFSKRFIGMLQLKSYGSALDGRPPSETAAADLVLLRLGISLAGWEAETSDLVRSFVEGCRLSRRFWMWVEK
eukprot:s2179_g4.t1